jgi:tetratricopeptide (TPR) repeat protein
VIGASLALFAQLTIAVTAPDTMGAEPAWVTVRVSAPSVRLPRVIAPSFSPFTVGRTSTTSATEHAGGVSRVQVEMRYEIRAQRAGVFVIPPFEARWNSERVRSDPITIVVRRTPGATIPRVIADGRVDTTLAVSVDSRLIPDTVYVGQQTTYQVGVFIDEAIRSRLRRNPGFNPPEMRGMLAYDVQPDRGTLPSRIIGGKRYETHVYQRAVFPLLAGRHVIPSSQLSYSLPLSYSFFSREETHVLRTDSLVLFARELPAEGRPDKFSGAVGSYNVDAQLDGARLRVGDPARLTVRVRGGGNIKLLPRPEVTVPWATVIPAGETVSIDAMLPRVEGTKEFEWILTPLNAGLQELPPIEYPYFDPGTEAYEIAVTQPARIRIGEGALVADEVDDEFVPLAIRTTYRGAPGAPVYSRTGFWLLLLGVPIPAVAAMIARRPRKLRQRSASDSLRQLARSKVPPDAMSIRRAYVGALIERLYLRPNALATRAEFIRVLKRSGVSQETALRAERLLTRLDASAFAGGKSGRSTSATEALEIFKAIDAEARTKASLASVVAPLLLVIAVSASLVAEPIDRALEHFEAGVELYESGDHAGALDEFGRVVAIEPRAPDGWANLGTTAWAVDDTAAAVVGWQRALRLEPTAADARERLALVSAPPRAWSNAWIPPASADALAMGAGALWVTGWLLILLGVTSGGLHTRTGGTALVLSLLVAGAAVATDERLAARDLMVAGQSTEARTAPALSAPARIRIRAGDVVRSVQHRGGWTLVEVDGGREGWVHASELVSLRRN